ncbi:hypothetical protein ACSSZE_03510 [Acidithiobacillus caldus]
MKPTEVLEEDRLRVFYGLLNQLDAAGRMVVEVADSRWHVAVTRFHQGLQDEGLTRAFARYVTGLFRSKDDAITDYVQSVNLMGKQQDVLVSWASGADALKEELLVIQSCLNAAGVLENRQPLDFDLGADVSAFKKAIAGSFQYDNRTRKLEVRGDVDPGKLLAGMLSTHLTGGMRFTLRKNHLKNDPRLPMMAGIIALESMAGGLGLTCKNLMNTISILSTEKPHADFYRLAESRLAPAEQYLRGIFAALRPEIERLGVFRGTVMAENSGLALNGILDCLFKDIDFDGAFAGLQVLREIFELQNLHDSQAQSVWTLLSATVYLSAQVAQAKQLLNFWFHPDNDPCIHYSPRP